MVKMVRGGVMLCALFAEDCLQAVAPPAFPRAALRGVARAASFGLAAFLAWQWLNVRAPPSPVYSDCGAYRTIGVWHGATRREWGRIPSARHSLGAESPS